MILYICAECHEAVLNGFQVNEWTRYLQEMAISRSKGDQLQKMNESYGSLSLHIV